mgnify:CR=1 FL=1
MSTETTTFSGIVPPIVTPLTLEGEVDTTTLLHHDQPAADITPRARSVTSCASVPAIFLRKR